MSRGLESRTGRVVTRPLKLARTAVALAAYDQLDAWFCGQMPEASDEEVLEGFEILEQAERVFALVFVEETGNPPNVATVARPSQWIRSLVKKYS